MVLFTTSDFFFKTVENIFAISSGFIGSQQMIINVYDTPVRNKNNLLLGSKIKIRISVSLLYLFKSLFASGDMFYNTVIKLW